MPKAFKSAEGRKTINPRSVFEALGRIQSRFPEAGVEFSTKKRTRRWKLGWLLNENVTHTLRHRPPRFLSHQHALIGETRGGVAFNNMAETTKKLASCNQMGILRIKLILSRVCAHFDSCDALSIK